MGMGWIDSRGEARDIPELQGVRKILDGSVSRGKKPRRNLQGADLQEAQQLLQLEEEDDLKKAKDAEVTFVHYKGNTAIGQGCSFTLGAQQRLVQAQPIPEPGIQHMRVALSNP